ncbi:MAG TPA: hypothetical protein VIJ24_00985, partial [Verrucomicrobiae bacterium]
GDETIELSRPSASLRRRLQSGSRPIPPRRDKGEIASLSDVQDDARYFQISPALRDELRGEKQFPAGFPEIRAGSVGEVEGAANSRKKI